MISATFPKRKDRASKDSQGSTEGDSPEPKRIAAMSTPPTNSTEQEDAIFTDAKSDKGRSAIKTTTFDSKMDIILEKLDKLDTIVENVKLVQSSVEKINVDVKSLQNDVSKLQEDVVKEISSIKKSLKDVKKHNEEHKKSTKEELSKLQNSFASMESSSKLLEKAVLKAQEMTKELQTTTKEMEDSMNFQMSTCMKYEEETSANTIQIRRLEEDFQSLKDKNMKFETYNRRENLRFYGIPEEDDEDTKSILCNFLENRLGLQDASLFEIQRVHRTGKKLFDKPRAILARFLRFPDRETIFSKRFQLPKGFGIGPDYPPEVVQIRKSLMPKFHEAKRMGKKVTFSRREPHKLYIDGQEFTP